MNFQYLESIQDTYPQTLDNIFDCKSHALVCAFNRLGTLLAIGCLDGNILIYDFIAKTLSKTIQAHNYLIYSISWSKKSDILLSCSYDYSICLWSIINNHCLFRLTLFHTFPINVSFHPINSNLILINFFQNYSILFNRDNYLTKKNFYEILIDDNSIPSLPTDGWISTFDHDGQYILTGNVQGKLIIFSTIPSLKIIHSKYIDQHRITPIKQICIAKESKYIAILTIDKIRIYEWTKLIEQTSTNEYKCRHIFFDNVIKMKFMKINFSSDGKDEYDSIGFASEYICATFTRQHRLYIWEIFSGSLVKILDYERGKSISDIIWHPYQPIIISISDGILYQWSRPEHKIYPTNFHQIDENIVYHEDENEFDINKSELTINHESNTQQTINEEEEDLVDIISIEPFQISYDNGKEYLSEEDIVWARIDPISDEDEDNNE